VGGELPEEFMATVAEALVAAIHQHKSGNLPQAEQLYRQLLQVDTFCVRAWYLLGAACQAQEKLPDAVASFEQALRLQPDLAEAHNHLGVTLAQQNKFGRAIVHFRRALQLKPSFAEVYFHLGNALANQGKFNEAVASYQQAIRLQPALARNRLGLGSVLLRLKNVEAAMACFEEALRLKPDSPEPHMYWGGGLLDQGRVDEAVVHFREALRLQPDWVAAYAQLGDLAKEGRYVFSATELDRIRALVAKDTLAPAQRSQLHFTLAHTLDRQGSYEEAFQHYRQGNDLRRQIFSQRGLGWNAQAHHDYVSRLIATFTPEFFQRVAPFGRETDLPVFIVGVPRSGTTLVNQILSAHPQLAAPGELLDVQNLALEMASTLRAPEDYPACLAGIDRETTQIMAEGYLERLAQLGGGALRVTDKLPENYLHLGLIALLFPGARIIHCRRDPLDTCVSCYTHNFKFVRFATSLEDIGLYYREYERLMAHWRSVLPLRLYEVRYEELVADQETISRALVAFCGLEWSDSCLAFHETRRVIHTSSKLQVRQPIYARAIGRWKQFEAHLQPLHDALRGDPGGPSRGTPSPRIG
jgi:tetratricopeptide (TPR) repeat protein